MSLTDRIDRLNSRLEKALENENATWADRIKAKLEKLEARVEEQKIDLEAPQATSVLDDSAAGITPLDDSFILTFTADNVPGYQPDDGVTHLGDTLILTLTADNVPGYQPDNGITHLGDSHLLTFTTDNLPDLLPDDGWM